MYARCSLGPAGSYAQCIRITYLQTVYVIITYHILFQYGRICNDLPVPYQPHDVVQRKRDEQMNMDTNPCTLERSERTYETWRDKDKTQAISLLA